MATVMSNSRLKRANFARNEAYDIQTASPKLVHEPDRHRTRFDAKPSICASVLADHAPNLF